jgi:hypothetical protein
MIRDTSPTQLISLSLPLSSLLATPTTIIMANTSLVIIAVASLLVVTTDALSNPILSFDVFTDSLCTNAFYVDRTWTSLTSLQWGSVAVLDWAQSNAPPSSLSIPCAYNPFPQVASVSAVCFQLSNPSSNETITVFTANEWFNSTGCPGTFFSPSNPTLVYAFADTSANANDVTKCHTGVVIINGRTQGTWRESGP